MFTKQQVYEYLSEYPQDTVPDVLRQLGHDEHVDEYPDDVVEKAESIYKAMGVAANMQKKLSESMPQQEPLSSEIVAAQIGAIASQLLESQDISLPPSAVMALAQATVIQTVELADRLALLQERTFATRLEQNREIFTQKVLGLSARYTDTVETVLSDEAQSEFIQAAAPALPAAKDVVKVFLSQLDAKQKASRQISSAREEQRKALPAPTVDVKAFLAARS